MRKIAKIDHNQSTIVAQLRQLANVTVQSLAPIGNGCPDILVGIEKDKQKQNFLFEIKNPNQPPCKRKLTDDEKEWHETWHGQVNTVESVDEILQIIGVTK